MKRITLIILYMILSVGLSLCLLSCSQKETTFERIDTMNSYLSQTQCQYIDDVLDAFKGHYDERSFIDTKNNYFYIWDSQENRMILMNQETQVVYPEERKGDYLSGNRYVALIATEEELLFLKPCMFTFALGCDADFDITFFFASSFDLNHHSFTGHLYYSELASGEVFVRGLKEVENNSKELHITFLDYE